MKTIKCPWCGKDVKLSKKGHILSHLVSTGVKCIGVGVGSFNKAAKPEPKKPKRKPRL